jgi:hypothetical protein
MQRETSVVHVDLNFALRTSAIRELMRAACPNTADDTAVRINRTPAAPQHPKLSHVTKHVVRDAVDNVDRHNINNLFRSCFNNNAQLLMRVFGA